MNIFLQFPYEIWHLTITAGRVFEKLKTIDIFNDDIYSLITTSIEHYI